MTRTVLISLVLLLSLTTVSLQEGYKKVVHNIDP